MQEIAREAQLEFENKYELDLDEMTPDQIEELSPEIKQDLAQTVERINKQATDLLTDPDFVIDGVLP